jgi:hypothetical protein
MTSWTTYKDLGARSFSSNNYHEALAHYTRAIDLLSSHTNGEGNEANEVERQHQILLSNVIACRLKIGGEEMANKAVEEAQQVRVACWLLISSVEPLQCDFAVHDMCFVILSV